MARTVVITGGTAGIGLATAEAFANKGWQVAVLAREPGRVREAAEKLRACGAPQSLGLSVDVSDAVAVDKAADRIEAELGPIDVWVNNAMSTVVAPSWEISPEELRRVTDVTYHGKVFGTLAAVKRMRKRNRGVIVQVNSVLGIRAFPLQSAYCAAKSAGMGFTDSLRGELLHEKLNIKISTVYLPAVNTTQFAGWARNHTGRRQIAPPPVYDARLCAEAILFAASNPRRDIFVGRTTVLGAVLQRISPKLADLYSKGGWDGQLSRERIPFLPGNLFEPGTGPACIDGPFTDKVLATRRSFWTSRQRDVALLTAGFGLMALMGLLRRSRSKALRRPDKRPVIRAR